MTPAIPAVDALEIAVQKCMGTGESKISALLAIRDQANREIEICRDDLKAQLALLQNAGKPRVGRPRGSRNKPKVSAITEKAS